MVEAIKTTQTQTQPVEDFLENMSFQRVKKNLQEKVGVDFSGYRDEYLKRRIAIRLRATNTLTYGRYLQYLAKNPDEYPVLLNEITVNYTTFMRDTDVYQYLEHQVLPKIFQKSPVRIWSAGCASGEEPYSLAILTHKLLGDKLATHNVTIYASDIDKDALSKAAKGEYQEKQVQGINGLLVDNYFTKEDGVYKVKNHIKQLVRFEEFDLMKPAVHTNLDLILCRNVMIYFSREGQQRVHMNFYNALRDGGYFVSGKAEILSGEPAAKFVPVDIRARVYQRQNVAFQVKA
ncbi:MAG: CheR family methyltransferase [Candidatus Bathyarchaeia archaeon]